MQSVHHIAYERSVVHAETYVGTQVLQVGSIRSVWPFDVDVVRELPYTFGDIRFYIFLFTLVLVAPFARSGSHSARQSHGVHLSAMSANQSLGRSDKPCAAALG